MNAAIAATPTLHLMTASDSTFSSDELVSEIRQHCTTIVQPIQWFFVLWFVNGTAVVDSMTSANSSLQPDWSTTRPVIRLTTANVPVTIIISFKHIGFENVQREYTICYPWIYASRCRRKSRWTLERVKRKDRRSVASWRASRKPFLWEVQKCNFERINR